MVNNKNTMKFYTIFIFLLFISCKSSTKDEYKSNCIPGQLGEVKEGIITCYYTESKNIATEFHVQNYKLEGINKLYTDDAKLMSEGMFHEGKPNGLQKFYYQNGKPSAVYYAKDRKLDGTYTHYDEFGNKQFEMTFTNDIPINMCRVFDKNQKVIFTVTYEKGKIIQIKNIENKSVDKSKLFLIYPPHPYPNVCFIDDL